MTPGASPGRRACASREGRTYRPLFQAAIEATEAAIVNALLAAETTTGRNGATAHRLGPDRPREAMGRDAGLS